MDPGDSILDKLQTTSSSSSTSATSLLQLHVIVNSQRAPVRRQDFLSTAAYAVLQLRVTLLHLWISSRGWMISPIKHHAERKDRDTDEPGDFITITYSL